MTQRIPARSASKGRGGVPRLRFGLASKSPAASIILRTLLSWCLITPFVNGADLRTLSGKTLSGELVSVSDKEVVIQIAGERKNLLLGEILTIDLHPSGSLPTGIKYSEIELIDGSLIHCTQYRFKGSEVELKLLGSEQVTKIPLASISYILNDAQDQATRQEWMEKFLPKKRNQDIVAIKLNGVINDLDGTLGEANDKGEIAFEYESGGARKKRDLDPNRIQGLIFLRTLSPQAPSSLCKVHDSYANVLVAAKLAMTEKSFTIMTVSGANLEYPRQAIARLDFTNDKVVFLSDLKPVETIEKSRQGRKDNLRLDKNLENSSLQMEGQVYAKGLALHSHTELVYALDGKYKEFKAVLGVDDTVGGDGRPTVKIDGDGKELFVATVTRKDRRRELALDVKGVRQLRIVVTSSDLLDFGDHVDLADAKLSK